MKAARGVAGVEARAIGYSVSPSDDKRPTWTAQQTLELRGSDGPALRRKAHDAATTAALKELQERAASAAATLGLHVRFLRDVRLDEPDLVAHGPFRVMGLAARAMVAPPPQATATPEDVTAEAAADVVLHP